MTDSAPAATPVALDRVDRSRGQADGVRLRLSGRWLGPGDPADLEPLLVVTIDGRRHRFPADRTSDAADRLPAGRWEARFDLPTWAEPTRPGQAALWLGDSVVPVSPPGEALPPVREPVPPPAAIHVVAPTPVPPSLPSVVLPAAPAAAPHHARLPAPPALGEASPWPPGAWPGRPASAAAAPAAPGAPVAAGEPGEPGVSGVPGVPGVPVAAPGASSEPVFDTGRPGPLAELLFKESVTALHGELDQRAAEIARLRGELADARAELESRTAKQASLESAHADLRAQLQELMEAAGGQRREFDQRLSELQGRLATAERRQADADRGRAAAQEERDRVRAELDAEKERARADLTQTREELADERARAAERLSATIDERDAQAAQVVELRDHLGRFSAAHQRQSAEVSTLREQLAAASVAREAAAGEVAGLQAELQRLGSELAVSREQLEARGGNLGEAERLLADARALTEQLRGETAQ